MLMKVLLADDEQMFRMSLASRLALEPDLEIVAQARDGAEAVKAYLVHHPDVVLMDLTMPKMNGVDATREIMGLDPTARIIAITGFGDAVVLRDAILAGAMGFVVKRGSPDELVQAITQVLAGQPYISPIMSKSMVEIIRSTVEGADHDLSYEPNTKERMIIQLVSEGRTSKEISSQLGLTPRTVDVYRCKIRKRLGLTSAAGFVQYATKHHLI
jgi:DNA-binding NarL/FixJ family response regulator